MSSDCSMIISLFIKIVVLISIVQLSCYILSLKAFSSSRGTGAATLLIGTHYNIVSFI